MFLGRCFPALRSLSPLEIRARIDASGTIGLREMAVPEAATLATRLQQHGFECRREDGADIRELPLNRTWGMLWLLADPEAVEEIVQQMISAGVPVEDVETCSS